MKLFVTFFLVVIFGGLCYGSVCKYPAHAVCPSPVAGSPDTENALPDAEYLANYCSAFLLGFKCLMLYNETCGSEKWTDSVLTLQKIHDVVEDICDEDTEIGMAYRMNVDCMNGISDEVTLLIGKLNKDADAFVTFLQAEEADLDIRKYQSHLTCLSIEAVSEEMGDLFERKCGEEAKKFEQLVAKKFLVGCPNPGEMERFEELFATFVLSRDSFGVLDYYEISED